MRDPERIDRILKEIEKTWKEHPDMRFFQLLINMGLMPDDREHWNIEDDRVEEFLKNHGLSVKSVFRSDKSVKGGKHESKKKG